MAALTASRPTDMYGGVPAGVVPERYYLPVAANVHIFQGALVVVDSSGNANPAGNASGSYVTGGVVGRADVEANNTGGAAAAIFVTVRQGAFLWDISGSLTKANFGSKVYAVDDHTVILSNTSPNTTTAGLFMGIDNSNGGLNQAIVLTIGVGSFGAVT